MMRNENYFVILFLVNDYLHFLKEVRKSNLLLVISSSNTCIVESP